MKKTIKKGDAAPVIRTTDLYGNKISIPTNNKWVFLSFHRFAACPFCLLRTNELMRNYDQFEAKNIEIITLWPSDEEVLLRYAGSEATPLSIVSDKEKSIYKAYGVVASSFVGALRLMLHPKLMFKALKNKPKKIEVDADPMLMPSSFLVDPTGIVQMAYYGQHFGDHPEIEAILSVVK